MAANRKAWADRLQFGGMFLVLFYLYFRFQGPAVNTAHRAYRLSLLVVGLVLMATSFILRARRG
jgi:hypothetical protein